MSDVMVDVDDVMVDVHGVHKSFGPLEVLRGVHAKEPCIVFIVLTNHAEPAYQQRCLQLGASYFLDKSHHFETAANIVSGLCKQPH